MALDLKGAANNCSWASCPSKEPELTPAEHTSASRKRRRRLASRTKKESLSERLSLLLVPLRRIRTEKVTPEIIEAGARVNVNR